MPLTRASRSPLSAAGSTTARGAARSGQGIAQGDAETFLHAIVRENAGGWLELRWTQPNGHGWGSEWYAPSDVASAASFAVATGAVIDVYAGTALRIVRRGVSANVKQAFLLSADCDTDEALDLLAAFPFPPTMLVESGRRTERGRAKLHAHWALSRPIGRADLEGAKRRLAWSLASDPQISDAARIMRIPGTANHKLHGGPVRLVVSEPARRYAFAEIAAALADRHVRRARPASGAGLTSEAYVGPGLSSEAYVELFGLDPVKMIPPPIYTRALTECAVPDSGGKIRCVVPDHPDDDPSLHVYSEPHRGWHCYGCDATGDAYTMAAYVWGLRWPVTGEAFVRLADEVRRELRIGWERQ